MRRRSEPVLEDLPDTGSLRGDLLALVQRMFDGMKGVDGGLMCGLAVAVRSDAAVRPPAWRPICMSRSCAPWLRSCPGPKPGASCRPVSIPSWCWKSRPGVALFHQMSGEPLDAAFAEHLVDRVLIPLLRP